MHSCFGIDSSNRVEIELNQLFSQSGLRPVEITHAGDGSNRLFIVDQNGSIYIWDGTQVLATPFLDIENQVACCNERGLLGLAFHPDYSNNGLFYVHYSDNSGDTQISQFVVSANPNIADSNSELMILDVNQPFPNHNGGKIAFGPDGYLYISLGDGGSANDPGDRGQSGGTLLGKLLRVNINSGAPYTVPGDNPFVNDPNILDEIWALGLRNAWKFSFDKQTGDMWIADVGQNEWEEINMQPANSTGGENYGWRCYEGNNPFNTSGCGAPSNYIFPVFEYNHDPFGCSITGGFVYRGTEYPELQGQYLFIDYCTGNIWALSADGQGGWDEHLFDISGLGFGWLSFGEDENGELYLGNVDGTVYKIQKHNCNSFSLSPEEIEMCEEVLLNPGASGGFEPYTYSWTGGSTGDELVVSLSGNYSVTVTDAIGCELTHEFNVTVIQFPPVSITNLNSQYFDTDPAFTLVEILQEVCFQALELVIIRLIRLLPVLVDPIRLNTNTFIPVNVMKRFLKKLPYYWETGIDDFEDVGYMIYPNPTRDELFIQFNAELVGSYFDLTNEFGQVVFKDELGSDLYEMEVDFEAGIYFMRIYHDDSIYIRKLLIF